jgi:hypothetical protein
MSGLPDEAVEAMARAAYESEWFRRQEVWALSWEQTTEQMRAECRRDAATALAALPAGVYVSDGQGKVEAVDKDEARAQIATRLRTYRSPGGQGNTDEGGDWRDLTERGVAQLSVAALSAKDTEH